MNETDMNCTSPETEPEQIRCACGSLMARRTGDLIELKCRRCRRLLLLELRPDGGVELRDERLAPLRP